MSLTFLLQIGLLIFSIVSVVGYASRRAEDRASRHRFLEQLPVVRPLSAEELEALQLFLGPAGGKRAELISSDALKLVGEFRQHGLSVHGQGASTTLHNTIGGVDVVLPYDAEQFLQPHNRAEVAMTPKFAIVVRLNDGFDLLSARLRALERGQLDQAWKDGRELQPKADPAANANPASPQNPAEQNPAEAAAPVASSALQVQMLGQRDETESERRARGAGVGGWAAVALLVGILSLGLSSAAIDKVWSLALLGIAVLGCTFGLWRAARSRAVPQAQRVNRVSGPLMVVEHQAATHAGQRARAIFVGDRVQAILPPHWAEWVRFGERDDLEVRVDDHAVLRYGPVLSVDEEERLFPSVRWGRALLLGSVGLLSAGVLWCFDLGQMADVAHARAWLQHGQPATDLAALEQAPVWGFVQWQGQARHALSAAPGRGLDNERWRVLAQAPAPVTPAPSAASVDDAVEALYDGSFVRTSPSMAALTMNLMRQALAGASTDPLDRYRAHQEPSVQTVRSMGSVIDAVEKVCSGPSAVPSCGKLHQQIAGSLQQGDDESEGSSRRAKAPAGLTWSALMKLHTEGQLEGGVDIDPGTLREWKAAARAVANEVMAARLDREVAALRAHDVGGVVIQVPSSWAIDQEARVYMAALAASNAAGGELAPSAPAAEAPEAPGRSGMSVPHEVKERLARLDQWAAGGDVWPVQFDGLVVERRTAADGAPLLVLDPKRNLSNALPAAQRVLAMLLALALAVGGLSLFAWRLKAASARARAIQAHWAGRLRGSLWR